jgi:chromosome segregation ATPase
MCEFRYNPPYPQFNPRLVHGLIGKLFQVKDAEEHGIALTQLLGGRIFTTVVVENQDVAK